MQTNTTIVSFSSALSFFFSLPLSFFLTLSLSLSLSETFSLERERMFVCLKFYSFSESQKFNFIHELLLKFLFFSFFLSLSFSLSPSSFPSILNEVVQKSVNRRCNIQIQHSVLEHTNQVLFQSRTFSPNYCATKVAQLCWKNGHK